MKYCTSILYTICLVYGLLSIDLQAQSKHFLHSQKKLEIEKDWSLVFSNGSSILIKDSSNQKLSIQISKGISDEILDEKNIELNPSNFSDINQQLYIDFSSALHQKKLEVYLVDKSVWDKNEQARYQIQSSKWELENNKFIKSQTLAFNAKIQKWTLEKEVFDKKENARMLEETSKWGKKQAGKDEDFKEDYDEWLEDKKEREEDKIEHEQDEKERVAEEIEEIKEDWKEEKYDFIKENITDLKFKEIREKSRECISAKDKNKCLIELKNLESENETDTFIKYKILENSFQLKLKSAKPLPFDDKKPQKKDYLVKKPKRKPFREKPAKPETKYLDKVPYPDKTKPYTQKVKPEKDTAPGYNMVGLLLYLSKNDCQSKNFQYQNSKGIHYVKSQKMNISKSINWPQKIKLFECNIDGRLHSKNISFLSFYYGIGQPFFITKGQNQIQLIKIDSPALKALDDELVNKNLYIKDLLSFYSSKSKEPIIATYETTVDGVKQYITTEYSNNKSRVKIVMENLPHFILDTSVNNKNIKIDRVSYLKETGFKGKQQPLLKNHYWYYDGQPSKNWQYIARYKYGLTSDNNLGVKIDRKEKKINGKIRHQGVSITGLISDFTSFWYIIPWFNASKHERLKIGFYDDKIYQGMVLVKTKKSSMLKKTNIFDFKGHQREISTQEWALQNNKTQKNVFQFQVGVEDNIIYKIVFEGTVFTLIKIKSNTVKSNINWYNTLLAKENIFRL